MNRLLRHNILRVVLVLNLPPISLAIEEPQALADHYNTLTGPLSPTGPSVAQFDAFRYLVAQGPPGWELLIQAQFDASSFGDAARRINSFYETSSLPTNLVEGYEHAQRAELLKRVINETWALLYAGACEQVEFHARGDTSFIRLDQQFELLRNLTDRPIEALLEVASLRVMLVKTTDFPGHRFPWTGSAQQQKEALHLLIHWWQKHRNEYKPKDA